MAIATCTFFSTGNLFAQQAKGLTIGDQAPALQYGKWIKGEPVVSLTGNQLYVLEFWATWCVPCIKAMPHLTKLQQEYKNKVNFIGVNIAERVDEDKPYDSSLPAVVQFVETNAAKIGFSVIADNNAQFMYHNWLKASGQNGIPATFIVKDNKVVWIGGPQALDTIIPKILENRYDMEAFKSRFKEMTETSKKQSAYYSSFMNPIEEAFKAKNYVKVVELTEAVKKEKPDLKTMMDQLKFKVLLAYLDEKKAVEFGKVWQSEDKAAPSLILQIVGKEKNKQLSHETYLWTAKNFGDTNALTNPELLDELAGCFAKGGDFRNAIVNEEKALELAKKMLKAGSKDQDITTETVAAYESRLKSYKESVK
ncbi:Redoxin [Pedobacter africanus]|uniref:Redoxin n=2 Tax=Pedobacter africanus TaxID=151894 RepID=A0A1W1ZFE4_9SPHI|nr:Redoxin [Pedobacter africanus]